MSLQVRDLVYRHAPGAAVLLDGVDLDLRCGEILCLLGPNGTGKTTLLRCLLGVLVPERGHVLVDGNPSMPVRERALHLGYVPQSTSIGTLSLFDIALMGRTPHLHALAMPTACDRAHAWDALERVGIAHLGAQPLNRVSGGERQLALIARALTQQPRLLLMDEPTASLDLGNQARVLSTLRALAGEGIGVLLTTHQPEHALLLDARTVALRGGRLHASGPARKVLDAATLSQLYGVPVEMLTRNGQAVACIPSLPEQVA